MFDVRVCSFRFSDFSIFDVAHLDFSSYDFDTSSLITTVPPISHRYVTGITSVSVSSRPQVFDGCPGPTRHDPLQDHRAHGHDFPGPYTHKGASPNKRVFSRG